MSHNEVRVEIRKATVRDVARMLELINGYAKEQVMLPRSPLAMYETLRDFQVLEEDGEVVGCGGVHVVWGDMAELRSIAVHRKCKGKGYGRAASARGCIEDARERSGVPTPSTPSPTYRASSRSSASAKSSTASLPHKVFGDCLNCPKFNACDEIAMLRHLVDPEHCRGRDCSSGKLVARPASRPVAVSAAHPGSLNTGARIR